MLLSHFSEKNNVISRVYDLVRYLIYNAKWSIWNYNYKTHNIKCYPRILECTLSLHLKGNHIFIIIYYILFLYLHTIKTTTHNMHIKNTS